MKPVVINGETWNIRRVAPTDPILIDRTGTRRIATTDPSTRSINISNDVNLPLFDRVLLLPLRYQIPESLWITVEEWSAELLERHGIEAAILASESLGRPLCIMGYCMMAS